MKKILLTYYQLNHGLNPGGTIVTTGLDTIIEKASEFPNVPFMVNVGLMGYGGVNPDEYPNTPMDFGTTEQQGIIRQAILDMQAVGCEVVAYIFSGVLGRTIENMRSDIDSIIELYPTINGFFIDNYGDNGGTEKVNLYCQYINEKIDNAIILANSHPVFQSGGWTGSYPNWPTHHIAIEGSTPPSVETLATVDSLGRCPTDNIGVLPYMSSIENLPQEYLEGAVEHIGLFGYYGAPFDGYYINGDLIDHVATFLATVNPPIAEQPSSITIRGSSDIPIETNPDGIAFLYSSAGTARLNPTEQIEIKYN